MCFLPPEILGSFGNVRAISRGVARRRTERMSKARGRPTDAPAFHPSTLDLSLMRRPHFRMNWLATATWLLLLLLVPPVEGQSTTLVTLDQAIDLSLAHNHSLRATRTLILQNQAQEITANLRPNPTFGADTQFVPFF